MSPATKHPNRIPFEGLLTRLDVPSDKAPSGARGHCVILTSRAAQDALESLKGMAVSFKTSWDSHDRRQKCGVITDAYIEAGELRVQGYIYGNDYPEVIEKMAKPNVGLGMSYEMVDAAVEDMRQKVWTLTRVTFTGAAILLRSKAAYKSTTIALLTATAERFDGKLAFRGQGRIKLVNKK
jgi:hypothetical protein